MTARTVVALSWSLIIGLVGGWLLLSPWALGEWATGGDWPPVVKAEFFGGVGLVALALSCLLMVTVQVVATLRSSGRPAESPELESTLVAVAQALTADLMAKGSAPGGETGPQPAGRAPLSESRWDGRREDG